MAISYSVPYSMVRYEYLHLRVGYSKVLVCTLRYLLACSVDNGNGIVIYDVKLGVVLYKTRVDLDMCFCAFTQKNLNGRILFGYLSDRIKGKIN